MDPEAPPSVVAPRSGPPGHVDPAPPHRGPRPTASTAAALGCARGLVSYVCLPWLTFEPTQRQRVREALQPEVDALAERAPERAEGYRALLRRIVDEGELSGVDL